MSVPLSDFAKYVRPEVAGCPDIVLLDAILRAGIEFCKDTRIIKQTLNVTTIVDQPRYLLTTAQDTLPENILAVSRNQYDQLDASSFREFENLDLNNFSGTPQYFYLDVDDYLVLGRVPNSVETLQVTVKVRPSEDAVTLPDELSRRYKHQIASGAKSILMLMKDQPWTDIANASIHKGLFEEAINEANSRDAKGASRKPLRTRPQHF